MAKPIAQKEDGEADDVVEASVDEKSGMVVAGAAWGSPDNGNSNSPWRVWRAL
jgi:hypothetical protein